MLVSMQASHHLLDYQKFSDGNERRLNKRSNGKLTDKLINMENIKDPDQLWRIQKARLLIRFSQLVEGDFKAIFATTME
jgi:hypothetical protein